MATVPGASAASGSSAPPAAGDLPQSLQGTHDDDKKELANLVHKASERNTGAQEGTGSGPPDLPSAIPTAIENDAMPQEVRAIGVRAVTTAHDQHERYIGNKMQHLPHHQSSNFSKY